MGLEDSLLGEVRRQPWGQQIRSVLTPDFLRRGAVTKRAGPTAWLDGLRGWAALAVCVMHLTVYTHDGIEVCYGDKFRHNDNHNTTPIALPILRLPFTGGHFAVLLFFAISGYVVPRRMLQLLQERRRQDFLDSMHSALVRRPIRLLFPVYISTICIFLTWHTLGIKPPWPPLQSNIFLEFYAWLRETLVFSYFYRIGWLFSHFNPQTWTIMVELRGSMFIFVWLMMVHTLTLRTRALLTAAMTIYLGVLAPGAWYACFFGGMFLSELEVIALSHEDVTLPWDGIDKWLRARPQARTVLLHILLLFTLHLGSQPIAEREPRSDVIGNCTGWKTLTWLIPRVYVDLDTQYRWYWLFWASVLMLYVVREIPWLRKCFEMQTAQYLGKHSFALYLIHGPMILIFSEPVFFMLGVKKVETEDHQRYAWYADKLVGQPWWPLPEGGLYGLEPNFLFCLLVNIPVFLYVAEIGTRIFDEPSVKLSQWTWNKVKAS